MTDDQKQIFVNMESFAKNFKSAQTKTDLALQKFLQKYKNPTALYKPVQYVVSTGGKRIRPILVLWAAGACNTSTNKALPAAVAVELFHTFTLVHDDIMDNAKVRRNHSTINATNGINTALLAGDTLLGLAYQALLQLDKSAISTATKLLTNTLVTVCEGQSEDEELSKGAKINLATYYKMISKKTAALLKTSVALGALVAKAPKKYTKALEIFAEELGLGFQIQDDVLDIAGTSKNWGKEFGIDLQNGKKTVPLLLAETYIRNKKERSLFKKLCTVIKNKKQKPSDFSALKQILEKNNIIKRAVDLYTTHFTKATASLRSLPNSVYKTNLAELVHFLKNRQS